MKDKYSENVIVRLKNEFSDGSGGVEHKRQMFMTRFNREVGLYGY